jgi:hypothetical protein
MSPDSESTSRLGGEDHFTCIPTVVALSAFLLMLGPWALGPFGGLVSLLIPLLIVILGLMGAVWLVSAIISLHWRFSLSIATALLLYASCSVLLFRFPDEFRWQVARPYYLWKVARLPDAGHGPKSATFWWNGGTGWDVGLKYFENDAESALLMGNFPQGGEDRCKYTLKQLEPHFYLDGVYC